jgi:hypothetical protein
LILNDTSGEGSGSDENGWLVLLKGQKDQINEVSFSHSGDYLFVPTGAGSVVTYAFSREGDAAKLTEFHRYEAHACVINCIGTSTCFFPFSVSTEWTDKEWWQ